MSFPQFEAQLTWRYYILIVLHPCLRSHWFTATAEPNNAAAQKEAIRTAEEIFKYVAETYLETRTPATPTAVPRPVPKPITKMPSFLASACSFQRPTTAVTTTPVLKRTPQEELSEELARYFNFEAAPIERQEDSEEGTQGSGNEPSAEEVLMNPLLWWKVSTLFIQLYPFIIIICFKMHASEFPIIAQMAWDYLAIPATSVSVERVFSQSRHICNNLRSSLKEKTITMALLTKVWIRSGLFEMMPPKIQRRKHGDNLNEKK